MSKLILLRHGQSKWNQENRFTGWVDVPLSPTGIAEAQTAYERLKNIPIDVLFTSVLQRAQDTAKLCLGERYAQIQKHENQALNERHYGDLQGLNKDDMRQKYGEEQVHIWRRSYDVKPPGGESLKDTCERVLPYFHATILPEVKSGKNVLVVAHGNSLRGIIKDLESLDEKAIVGVEIPTGIPIVYDFDTVGHLTHKTILKD